MTFYFTIPSKQVISRSFPFWRTELASDITQTVCMFGLVAENIEKKLERAWRVDLYKGIKCTILVGPLQRYFVSSELSITFYYHS